MKTFVLFMLILLSVDWGAADDLYFRRTPVVIRHKPPGEDPCDPCHKHIDTPYVTVPSAYSILSSYKIFLPEWECIHKALVREDIRSKDDLILVAISHEIARRIAACYDVEEQNPSWHQQCIDWMIRYWMYLLGTALGIVFIVILAVKTVSVVKKKRNAKDDDFID